MLKLVISVVAIALPDCINPSLIAGELFVATGARPRWRTAAFALAAFLVTFLFGLAFALGLGNVVLALVPKLGPTVKYALITGAGALLVVGGTVVWVRRRSLRGAPPTGGARRMHGGAALIGGGIAGIELLTAFPYFAAIGLIVGSGVSTAGKLSLLLLYCVIYTLPLIVIAVLVAVLGERAERILAPAGRWLFGHWPAIVGPLTAVVGVGVLVFGLVQLV